MFTKLEYVNPYTPQFKLELENALDLFASVKVTKWNTANPANNSGFLYLSLPLFNNKSVYVKPCQELKDILTAHNIYGKPKYKDVYLKLDKNKLVMQYQHIIGSWTLIMLDENQSQQLINLVK